MTQKMLNATGIEKITPKHGMLNCKILQMEILISSKLAFALVANNV